MGTYFPRQSAGAINTNEGTPDRLVVPPDGLYSRDCSNLGSRLIFARNQDRNANTRYLYMKLESAGLVDGLQQREVVPRKQLGSILLDDQSSMLSYNSVATLCPCHQGQAQLPAFLPFSSFPLLDLARHPGRRLSPCARRTSSS